MTTIERTAYPRFKRNFTAKDLVGVYTPTPQERFLAFRSTKGCIAELGFLVLLKTYQRLGRFIPLSEVPVPIIEHIARLIDPHLDVSDLDSYDQGVTVFHSALTQENCNNDLLTKRCLIGVSAGSLLVERVCMHRSIPDTLICFLSRRRYARVLGYAHPSGSGSRHVVQYHL